MKFYDKLVELKKKGYTKDEIKSWAKALYAKRKRKWSKRAQDVLDEALSVKISSITIEDIIPEIDIPRDLNKLTEFQREQIVNFLESMDKKDINRRYRQSGILLNLASKKGKTKLYAQGKILSNLIYEVKLRLKR